MAEKIVVNKKLVDKSDTVVKFGFGQITNTTPQLATKVFRVILYTVAVLTLVTQTVTEIPVEISTAIAKYSVQAVALVHGISKLFGIEIKEN